MAIILNSGSNINVFVCVNFVNDYSISVQWICYTVIVYTCMCEHCEHCEHNGINHSYSINYVNIVNIVNGYYT